MHRMVVESDQLEHPRWRPGQDISHEGGNGSEHLIGDYKGHF